MKVKVSILFLALCFLTACGGDGGNGDKQEEQASTTFDSELSEREKQALDAGSSTMAAVNIEGARIKWFPEIFGGTTSANVVDYFQTRVHHFISASTNLNDRLVTQPAAFFNLQTALASNPSFALWYTSIAEQPDDLKFQINDQLVEIDSTRVGVMQVGDAFNDIDPVTQAITLVHEARHSDCTGGALRSDVIRVTNGGLPQNLECAHLHARCPAGHVYAGTFGCDSLPWGAYTIDAIYSVSISDACTTCTEAQKQAAEINALDVLQRPLIDMEAQLNGDFGPPDMSSSNEVR